MLDRELNRALAAAVREQASDHEVAVIVLDGGEVARLLGRRRGRGPRARKIEGMLEDFHGAIRALWDAECVTVAAIHGFAMGGGLELALAADLIVAESNARLGFPEIALGCYPPVAAAILAARVGPALANELVLTGESFTPDRASRWAC